jgi:molybdate transport system ATP-binding protein
VTLTAEVSVRRGDFTVTADVRVGDGETVAVVGPNGAGKTTLLLAIAGLVPSDGRIEAPGPIGVVFQDRRLFPHLSVIDNVAFGADSATARDWLARVGLVALGDARPGHLSGGQAQRVALARTLATDPAVLLLDEPFTALDVESRAVIASVIAEFPGPRLVVSHAPRDVASVADDVVVMEHGAVVQRGTLADLTAHPRSAYVAELVGVNRLVGRADGTTRIALDEGIAITAADPIAAGAVVVTFHPRVVALHERPPSGSPRNVFGGRVADVDRHGDRARVTVAGAARIVAEITSSAAEDLHLAPGREVWAAVKATEVTVLPA